LRKSTGAPLAAASLSQAFARATRWRRANHSAPSLAEIRSLSERLYSTRGVDTQTLLGHRRAATTAIYHDDRGLGRAEGRWQHLRLRRRRARK